ncbi:hypothetical protein FRUB_01402 [Fimbriiglobus ruber]|uniref:Uncharacterized protein n=1 Tax=Fimbriiglobus ruber TaxID=1908690 RepID=A0A225DUQ9_9BACT|nr:hypothetical protein FRUB_01402 [Fimbriiglobus ruber]
MANAGPKYLCRLMSQSLYLQNTKVTEAGVKKLAAALPECKIEWDSGVIGPAKPEQKP